ncbi:MAG TPA: tetratricopeptide repeat protein [Aestuariivirgaceae bacterium]|jgi:tetratricopeptide (TPR) repeat protein
MGRRSLTVGLIIMLGSAAPAVGQAEKEGANPPTSPGQPQASVAQQREELLDRLFGRLKTAKNEQEAQIVEQSIWRLWMRSGRPTDDILLEQATKSMQARQYDKALDILDAIIEHSPDFMEAWNKRATVNYIVGRLEQSLSDIDRVLALEPRHFGALSGLGMIRRDKGDQRGALTAFREALAINPFMPSVQEAVKSLEKDLEQKI